MQSYWHSRLKADDESGHPVDIGQLRRQYCIHKPNFDLLTKIVFAGYSKVISCTKFEHFEIIRF